MLGLLRRGSQLAIGRLTTEMRLSPSPAFRQRGQLRHRKCVRQCKTVISRRGVKRGIVILYGVQLGRRARSLVRRFVSAIRAVSRVARYCGAANSCSFRVGICTQSVGSCRSFVLGALKGVSYVKDLRDVVIVNRVGSSRCVPIGRGGRGGGWVGGRLERRGVEEGGCILRGSRRPVPYSSRTFLPSVRNTRTKECHRQTGRRGA